MHRYEQIAALYFAAVAFAGLFTRTTRSRKARGAVISILLAIGVLGAATLPDAVRVWLPGLYLIAGYWVPTRFLPAGADAGFERWLQRTDAAWRPPLSLPRWSIHLVELSYLLCYAMIPAGLVIVLVWGGSAQVERYWISVLLAGYLCYFSLPWVVSRPPRLLGAGHTDGSRVASMNAQVLGQVSHQFITFPSGHAAVATAVALQVYSVQPIAGILLLILAAGISVGAVAGHYHFLIDVAVGIVVGALAAAYPLPF